MVSIILCSILIRKQITTYIIEIISYIFLLFLLSSVYFIYHSSNYLSFLLILISRIIHIEEFPLDYLYNYFLKYFCNMFYIISIYMFFRYPFSISKTTSILYCF